jgi:hypothetical protein
MATKTIVVTREIIDASNGRNGDDCMVYKAAKPQLTKLRSVGIMHGSFGNGDITDFVPFPEDVSDKILQHYDGNDPEPFEFDWKVPDHLCD